MTYKKKLIEVALPLEAINKEAAREKEPFTRNHPRSLHIWWARRPLVACRAVLFASLVDDPTEYVAELLKDSAKRKAAEKELKARKKLWNEMSAVLEKAKAGGISAPAPGPEPKLEDIIAEIERERLFEIIRQLVKWENSNNERVLNAARAEIMRSCDDNPPPVYDPFCGGGSIPLEAQRLGLEAHASDLNPVPVLINKALIEIPPKFAGKPPVNPEAKKKLGASGSWKGAAGLAEDIRYYGKWMRDEAEKRIGHLYPKVKLPKEHGGGEARVIAWLWARTIECPNPACRGRTPLIRSFWLSKKKGKESYVHPVLDHGTKTCRFEVRARGTPQDHTSDRSGARCLFCGVVINKPQLRDLAVKTGITAVPYAVVAEGRNGRAYLEADSVPENTVGRPSVPTVEQPITNDRRWFSPPLYGMTLFSDLFTARQLTALSTFCDLVLEVRQRVFEHAKTTPDFAADVRSLNEGGTGPQAYADAVTSYLGLAVSRWADLGNSICSWNTTNQNIRALFARQAIPMSWDFAELSPFSSVGPIDSTIEAAANSIQYSNASVPGVSSQLDAAGALSLAAQCVISTDPPYYDNIGYADLSDFFYVWLRRSLGEVFPQLFSTLLTPKTQELIAVSHRHDGSEEKAKQFFEDGLSKAFSKMHDVQNPGFPMTVYYAFKQTESESGDGGEDDSRVEEAASTGWETMLTALIQAGLSVTGTWPLRTERGTRSVGLGTNALASSIVLVCRPRPKDAGVASRRDFLAALKRELPEALRHLQKGNIAPVDLAQAAIGPGMAVFSRYAKVLETDGSMMSVRSALTEINKCLDEVLAEQEGEFDADTRWALT